MSVIRNFLRRLNHSSGGQSNLLGIRILQLLLGLVGIILWAILFALYRQWMPKTREAGVYVLHGEWKPPSGFDKSVTFMLALVDPVIASFCWTLAGIFRPAIAASLLRNEYQILIELLRSTVLLACGIVAFWCIDAIVLQYLIACTESSVTIEPPSPDEDHAGASSQSEQHMGVLRGVRFLALVSVYLMA
ncbi:hypothetical protein IMSHALPRED_005790 [Imshaugia aleurites]|uniref:Uncharacterized protein n=1 Tax=Imshaugia aleurites TaxID=172621 RepID=A0A8H3IJ80_9LECA|nr:hypothetical protein IMSHALPRED_005790 [Imshaugia aleurites]